MRNLIERANQLPKSAWETLVRPPKYKVKTQPRQRPENVKERIVVEKEYENIKLLGEQVAEFAYRPTACQRAYRVIALLRKKLSVERGSRCCSRTTATSSTSPTIATASPAELAFEANGRCNQENLIAQLKGGVQALTEHSADRCVHGEAMVHRQECSAQAETEIDVRHRRVSNADARTDIRRSRNPTSYQTDAAFDTECVVRLGQLGNFGLLSSDDPAERIETAFGKRANTRSHRHDC